MKQFEYRVMHQASLFERSSAARHLKAEQEALDRLGAEGWELVAVLGRRIDNNLLFYFKRQSGETV